MEIASRRIDFADASGVGEARRMAGTLAAKLGFDEVDAGRVSIVASELGANIVKHAGRGAILISPFERDSDAGVEIIALDSGPGIADVSRAFEDGFSTAGTSGAGLGAVRRLSQTCEIYSASGKGVAILARVLAGWSRRGAISPPAYGGLSVAMPGEEACGDAWCVKQGKDGIAVLVVDGLGHGALAASAAAEALRAFDLSDGRANSEQMQRLHAALRPTRGAAASVVEIPSHRSELQFVGIGNVSGAYVNARETRRMVACNGTLGHAMKMVRPFAYSSEGETLVILATDGLATNWSLEPYPGLRSADPTLIAGVLYRDFARGRDDVTVVVVRRKPNGR